MLRKTFKKWKVKARKIYTVIALTILEIVLILWINNWEFHPVIIATLVQFCLIFEKRNVWERLTKKEKKEVMLDEEEGIELLIKTGKTSAEILKEIKKN